MKKTTNKIIWAWTAIIVFVFLVGGTVYFANPKTQKGTAGSNFWNTPTPSGLPPFLGDAQPLVPPPPPPTAILMRSDIIVESIDILRLKSYRDGYAVKVRFKNIGVLDSPSFVPGTSSSPKFVVKQLTASGSPAEPVFGETEPGYITRNLPAIPAGESRALYLDNGPGIDTFHRLYNATQMRVIADAEGDITESNEYNNKLEITFSEK